ncbi:hypothetical protein [Ottowia sp. VDI28]|uniref:hypothetical protein n=1 Tax=Ottowia sp. VDI28 TaxID=3133968 RepID=UPI003C2F0200
MATNFKDHSTADIESAVGQALEALFGAPVSVNISTLDHRPTNTAAAWMSGSQWAVDLQMRVADNPPQDED